MQNAARATIQSRGPIAVASGIRVVIMERDAGTRRKLQAIVEEDASFILVNITEAWPECERGLDEYLPELLIANAEAIPPQALSRFSPHGFPVGLWLGSVIGSHYGVVLEGLEDKQVRQALMHASSASMPSVWPTNCLCSLAIT